MMKIRVSEASRHVLDYMVAVCEGVDVRWNAAYEQLLLVGYYYVVWQPHKNWVQGGPIIERERVALLGLDEGEWEAWVYFARGEVLCKTYGTTPLIAAMRCYCCSKLGDEVDVPDELV